MPTILEKLIAAAGPKDYYAKGFAMLNCASLLKDSELEGERHFKALEYFTKIVSSTNQASDEFVSQSQKDLCMQAMQQLADFTQFYTSCHENGDINPEKLINEIIKQCEKNGFCYLPSGWISKKGGHYLSLKIVRNQDDSYDVSFLNHGAGINHHQILGKSDEKTKYDYQSHVYRFNLDSDSAKLFFHGILGLRLGAYTDNDCDEQDLYGLLALHGQLQQTTPDSKRKVTPQRSGTCTLTNTRTVIKDILLSQTNLSPNNTKRYEFYNKLSSIVTAYTHFMQSKDAQENEAELQVFALALNELYVRLEKSYPDIINNDELREIKTYIDKVNHQVTQFQQAILKKACSDLPIPDTTAAWHLTPLKERPETQPKSSEEKPVLNVNFTIRKCAPAEVKNYLKESIDYFKKAKESPKTLYEHKQWMHSLAPTSANNTDSYWDEVPAEDLTDILHYLVELNETLNAKGEHKLELALICYDIAAQIAPRIPELKLGNTFCLGLDDTFSQTAVTYEATTFLTLSHLAKQFMKRSKNKLPIFTHTIDNGLDTTAMQGYVINILSENIKLEIIKKIKKFYLSDSDWMELFLTGKTEKTIIDIMSFFPSALADIRALASKAQNATNTLYTKSEHDADYFLSASCLKTNVTQGRIFLIRCLITNVTEVKNHKGHFLWGSYRWNFT